MSYSRRIDDPDHASLAVSNFATVVPDRAGIVNGQCEDLGLWRHSISMLLFLRNFDFAEGPTDSPSVAVINPLKKLDWFSGWHGLEKAAWVTEWMLG